MKEDDLFQDITDLIAGKKRPKTYIAIVLDESGSMGIMRQKVINSFNEQIQTIRSQSKDMDVYVSLVTFSTVVNKILLNIDINEVKEMTMDDYNPNGNTALNDAIGLTIEKLKEVQPGENTSFLVNVITDGEENWSKKYRTDQIKSSISELTETGIWTFVWMISNIVTEKIISNYNVPIGNVMNYESSALGYASGAVRNTSATVRYMNNRSTGEMNTADFYGGNTNDDR